MRFITKKHIPRRAFLRGLSTAISLPLLDSMVPAQTPLSKTAANPQIRRPVQHFIHFYRQQDNEMGFLPRAVSSWLLAQRAD